MYSLRRDWTVEVERVATQLSLNGQFEWFLDNRFSYKLFFFFLSVVDIAFSKSDVDENRARYGSFDSRGCNFAKATVQPADTRVSLLSLSRSHLQLAIIGLLFS